jgi:hypothetical protein
MEISGLGRLSNTVIGSREDFSILKGKKRK